MRRGILLGVVVVSVGAQLIGLSACTDEAEIDDTAAGEVQAKGELARSVVAVTVDGRNAVCPGALLPDGIVMTYRACVEKEPCEKLDVSRFHVLATIGESPTDVVETGV